MVEAFTELSTCRNNGMGMGPIPLTAIHQYSDRHELGDLFVRQILQIDRAYLLAHDKKKEAK